MAKALVIKGANFSANKVTTVEFNDVPCTGISLSEDTLNFTGYDAVAVTAQLTPNDTTDEVIWSSSNASVATVSDGVITPVGIGTCIIRAICGEQSDTAFVTVAFAYKTNYAFAVMSYNSSTGILGYSAPKYDYILAYGKDNQRTEKSIPAISTSISGGVYGIKIPSGATKVKLTISNTSNIKNDQWSGGFQWLKDEALDESHPNFIKRISGQFFNLKTQTNLTFTPAEGADSFVFNLSFASESSSSNNPATIISDIGFGIEFLTD